MSFLAPLGLALGALAAPILALYFLRLRRKRVTVPSLLLWHQFQKSERLASPFQRFRKNLLLLLQLLLLLLIALAAARPFLESDAAPSRSVAIVIDATASMLATDVEPTRFEAARQHAERIVDQLGSTDEVLIVVAGPRTEVRLPFTRDHARAAQVLDELAATTAEGSLREGLQLAISMARSRPAVEVVVLSDGGGEALDDVPAGGIDVRFVPVGRSDANAGVLALDLRRSPVSDLERQLFVTVQSFGSAPTEGTVEVYIEDELVGLRTEALPPNEPVSFVFDVPGSVTGVLRVELDAKGDQLPADDRAFAVIEAAAQRRVLVVGGDKLTARALRADPRVELKLVDAASFSPALLADVDCTLFAGPVPSGLDGHPYAVLGPFPGSPVKFGEDVRVPEVLGWRRTHPIARYVAWDSIRVARARQVVDAQSLAPVVDGDAGPLLLAGERSGARVVQLAFDPFQSDILLRVAWPVTLLNTVGWLTEDVPGGEGTRGLPAGSPYTRRLPEGTAADAVRVTGPDGSAVSATVDEGLLRVRDTTRVGVYEVRIDGARERFAVNLLSPRESSIAPKGTLDLSGSVGTAVEAASIVGRREIWRELLLLALAVMLLEWWAWNRRRVA